MKFLESFESHLCDLAIFVGYSPRASGDCSAKQTRLNIQQLNASILGQFLGKSVKKSTKNYRNSKRARAKVLESFES